MGWNRPREKKTEVEERGRQRNGRRSGLVAGGIVVLGAAVAAWWIWPGSDDVAVVEQDRHALIKEVKPVLAKRASAVVTNAVAPKRREIPRKPDGSIDWTKIKPHELPPEMIGHDPEPKDPAPPVFSNSAEQVIAMVISTPPDQELPPLVGLGDDLEIQFFKSLETPVTVNADDPESVKALKESMIETKKQILQLINEGKTVTQIIEEHLEVFNENRKTYADSQKAVDEFFEAGELESAKAYIEKANPILESMGAPLLKMPLTKEERRAERRARREARKALQGASGN